MKVTAPSASERVRLIEKSMVRDYRIATRGSERYLTDAMRRAIVSDVMYSVMLARYETEAERPSPLCTPNDYVDAANNVLKRIGLRD